MLSKDYLYNCTLIALTIDSLNQEEKETLQRKRGQLHIWVHSVTHLHLTSHAAHDVLWHRYPATVRNDLSSTQPCKANILTVSDGTGGGEG